MKKLHLITIKLIMTAMFLAVSTTVAKADQAEWVTKAQAQSAMNLLNQYKNKDITHWCKPCGNNKSTERVSTVEVKEVQKGKYWQVFVNGKGIDLAYVYFKLASPEKGKNWKNLAFHLNIKVTSVDIYF
jgi:hypothetical protein